MSTAFHLALKEVWRSRARFLLFGLVVALITLLVLFIAALGAGLVSIRYSLRVEPLIALGLGQ